MASTSTTSTLRRYWSPSPSPPTSSPRPISRPRPLSQSSSPPYRSQLSISPTLTPGRSTAPSSSPSSAPSTASTALSTAPSTTYAAEHTDNNNNNINNINNTSNTAYRPSAPVTSEHVVTYIPPLVDGAGGTLCRWQRIHQQQQQAPPPTDTFRIKRISSNTTSPENTTALTPCRLLWSDIRWLATNLPEILRLAWNKASTPVWAVARPRVWSRLLTVPVDDIADAAEALLQTGLAVAEVAMLAVAPTLFLCLPGGLFLMWLVFCFAAVYTASWPLNGGAQARTGTVYRSWATETGNNVDEDDDSDSDDDNGDDSILRRLRAEHWFFLPGMGATSRSLAKTGPRVAAVFGRPVTLMRPAYTYGAVADALLVLLQRLLFPFCVLPARGVDSVYAELRRAVLATNNLRRSRIVVLAHNTGATVVSQALTRLASDVPASRLTQLEVYTFGSLAPDFVVPTKTGDQQADSTSITFHVEHVAHANDPCARFGVLRSVRDDLAGRYGGGVFVVGSGAAGGNVNSSNTTTSGGCVGLGLSVGSTTGFRPASRGRSFSPPFPPSAAANNPNFNNTSSIKNRNSRHRMSFPFTYQQQQQHQHFLQNAGYRRSISASTTSSMGSDVAPALPTRKTMLSMEDYLTALFGPEPWSMRPDPEVDFDGNRLSSSSDAFFLDAAISVDRELAEKREMAAMAAANTVDGAHNSRGSSSKEDRPSLPKTAHHRLSWTGLGATAKYGTTKGTLLGSTKTRRKSQLNPNTTAKSESPAVAEGLRGLETVRRLCKDCDGRPGREVSVLAGYFSDAVTRHREQFGF
ncbi:hypothetical protein Sste5346_003889 [Sporothrix stenoceras]|uniref:Transmembrane protein n=1 Tax=Sporothrix stenoceras TaxID=5173 RepID=A0ABR3ZB95_9PEZI